MSLNKEHQQRLLELAKSSIQHGLQTGRPLKINLADFPAELPEHRATFVTLHKHDQLRGCIGMLEAVRPLAEDIAENAFLASPSNGKFASGPGRVLHQTNAEAPPFPQNR